DERAVDSDPGLSVRESGLDPDLLEVRRDRRAAEAGAGEREVGGEVDPAEARAHEALEDEFVEDPGRDGARAEAGRRRIDFGRVATDRQTGQLEPDRIDREPPRRIEGLVDEEEVAVRQGETSDLEARERSRGLDGTLGELGSGLGSSGRAHRGARRAHPERAQAERDHAARRIAAERDLRARDDELAEADEARLGIEAQVARAHAAELGDLAPSDGERLRELEPALGRV